MADGGRLRARVAAARSGGAAALQTQQHSDRSVSHNASHPIHSKNNATTPDNKQREQQQRW